MNNISWQNKANKQEKCRSKCIQDRGQENSELQEFEGKQNQVLGRIAKPEETKNENIVAVYIDKRASLGRTYKITQKVTSKGKNNGKFETKNKHYYVRRTIIIYDNIYLLHL